MKVCGVRGGREEGIQVTRAPEDLGFCSEGVREPSKI